MAGGDRPVILLVGGGRMGGALLAGWLEADLADHVYLVEPAGSSAATGGDDGRLTVVADPRLLPPDLRPDIVVLAVKPQLLGGVAPAYRAFAETGAVTLSIAAGVTIEALGRWLGAGAALVRAMPNTPAAIGRGITAAVAGRAVTNAGRALADRLLSAVGPVEWLEDEALMDAVTAVSGSGPAYVFLLIEALAEAGRKVGLPVDLAERLARATVAGSGELARRSAEPASALRAAVTSPHGTTAAALAVLTRDDAFQTLIDGAVAAGSGRSRALAREAAQPLLDSTPAFPLEPAP